MTITIPKPLAILIGLLLAVGAVLAVKEEAAALHVPVTQIETGSGFGGECHLDANMVRLALPQVPLDKLDLLVIENVGNLVCPAEFQVGEHHRVMVCSVAEGEDKPLKYPLMF